jgi:hypothetical protein
MVNQAQEISGILLKEGGGAKPQNHSWGQQGICGM